MRVHPSLLRMWVSIHSQPTFTAVLSRPSPQNLRLSNWNNMFVWVEWKTEIIEKASQIWKPCIFDAIKRFLYIFFAPHTLLLIFVLHKNSVNEIPVEHNKKICYHFHIINRFGIFRVRNFVWQKKLWWYLIVLRRDSFG